MIRIKSLLVVVFLVLPAFLAVLAGPESGRVGHLQGEMAGEVTASSAVLQSRLTVSERSADRDVMGAPGVGRFELSRTPDFAVSQKTGWLAAAPEHDYYVREKIEGLEADTEYFYRLEFGPDRDQVTLGPTRRLRTLPGADISRKYTLAVIT